MVLGDDSGVWGVSARRLAFVALLSLLALKRLSSRGERRDAEAAELIGNISLPFRTPGYGAGGRRGSGAGKMPALPGNVPRRERLWGTGGRMRVSGAGETPAVPGLYGNMNLGNCLGSRFPSTKSAKVLPIHGPNLNPCPLQGEAKKPESPTRPKRKSSFFAFV